MSEERRGYKEHCEDEEEECIAVKGCRRGRPVKVRFEDGCDPLPVTLEKGCDPIEVIIKEKCGDPLDVSIKQKHCDPLKVVWKEDACVGVKNCDDKPLEVVVVNPPVPGTDTNSHVFDGTIWVPMLTPSKFVPIDNVGINGSGPVWTPPPGMKFRLMGFHITSSLAGQLNLRDGVGGPIISSIVLQAGVPFQSGPLGNGITSLITNNPLIMEVAAGPGPTSFVSGLLMGQEIV